MFLKSSHAKFSNKLDHPPMKCSLKIKAVASSMRIFGLGANKQAVRVSENRLMVVESSLPWLHCELTSALLTQIDCFPGYDSSSQEASLPNSHSVS